MGGIFLMGVGVFALAIILMLISWAAGMPFFRRTPETWPGEGQPIPYEDERVE